MQQSITNTNSSSIAVNPNSYKTTISAISYSFFAAGVALILITPFIVNENSIYATISGYISILIGLCVVYGYISVSKDLNRADLINIVISCVSLTIIVLLSMHLFSKHIDTISLGIVPNYTMLTFLSAFFVMIQTYTITQVLFPVKSTKKIGDVSSLLLICKLFNYSLIIILTIILKYFVTDG